MNQLGMGSITMKSNYYASFDEIMSLCEYSSDVHDIITGRQKAVGYMI